jgi:hypothetical protein
MVVKCLVAKVLLLVLLLVLVGFLVVLLLGLHRRDELGDLYTRACMCVCVCGNKHVNSVYRMHIQNPHKGAQTHTHKHTHTHTQHSTHTA